jgi:alpha-N-arabinofuranosidase
VEVLAVWAGYYLDGTYLSNSSMPPYVESVMNELEFLMGDTSTTYGALRASLGYPDPWIINYVEIGNEDNLGDAGGSYETYRFNDFYYPIHAMYPWITILPSTVAYDTVLPGNGTGDYHQYTRPDYFVSQFNYFDDFPLDRWTLLGEYAAVQPNEVGQLGVDWSAPRWPFPMWVGTVSEAVYLLGAERNADHIIGASYAPLFQNLDSWEWDPDMISFTADPSQDVMSTSYHLVQLYSGTRISETLPAPATDGGFGPLYWVAGQGATGSYILKTAVYNSTELTNSTAPYPVYVNFDGVEAGAQGTLTLLTAPGPYSYNDVGSDVVQTTVEQVTASANGTFELLFPDYSIALFEVQGDAPGDYGKRWNRFGK